MTFIKRVLRLPFYLQIILAILFGTSYGFFLTEYLYLIEWLGIYFMRGIKLIVIPLIFTSITAGVATMSGQKGFLTMGGKLLGYYLFTCVIAIVTGLGFVNLISPGTNVQITQDMTMAATVETTSLSEIVLNIIPANIFEAFATFNIIGIIFFSIFFGIFLGQSTHSGAKISRTMLEGISDVISKMTMVILKCAPVGVFSLIAKTVANDVPDVESLLRLLESQGLYACTVAAGILFHALITLSILLYSNGINPLHHLRNMREVLLFSFSTASSSGTLPLTIEHIKTRSKVTKEFAEFSLPVGATINMNGTSLYECVAVIFIAQAYGMDLSLLNQLTIVFISLIAGIGTAGIPMASLVMTVIILQTVGLPPESIGLILLVDRILDMMRTMLNVYSDTVCTLVVAKSENQLTE